MPHMLGQHGYPIGMQAYYSGPGPGAGSPCRAFALALVTLLCMPLQHVGAETGDSSSQQSTQ